MTDNRELASSILEQIQDCEEEDRYRSLRDQLYGIGPQILDQLRAELDSMHFRRRMAAATNLGRLGDVHSVPGLVALLNDPQPGVREMALFALGILGDTGATEAILGALTDYDADVRYRAVVALGDLGYAHIEDVLIRAMGDESYGVREQALSQLRTAGTPRAVPVILRALLEREPDMQQMAEECLDRLIPKMTREHYKRLQEQLTPRERRLILNYLEARNLPLVMLPHGGPHAHDTEVFDWWAQAFASRGYAVFQPNFRGSTNRDEAFMRAGFGRPAFHASSAACVPIIARFRMSAAMP